MSGLHPKRRQSIANGRIGVADVSCAPETGMVDEVNPRDVPVPAAPATSSLAPGVCRAPRLTGVGLH